LKENKKLNKSPRSQEELADDMYCSPYFIERILKGEEDLNLSMIVRLSKVLGVNLIQAL
jgi:plasmid maintenance system antidote protein VapI